MMMVKEFGCTASDIVAAIGPCISKCCFETRTDVPEAFMEALPGQVILPYVRENGSDKFLLDLKGINEWWLFKAGVKNISISDLCTACDTDMFWSHRVQGDERGSMASVIVL